MRFSEFDPSIEESAADELKRQLPSLKKTDYDTIDRLMQRISKRYRITGDKLHDIFVKKYKHTPDHWIKKYKRQLGEAETSTVNEEEAIKKFIDWSIKKINLDQPYPKIQLSRDTEAAQKGHHTGVHTGDEIWVYIGNRNLIDIFRTIFHELVHHKQDQMGMIQPGDSYPGSPIEAMADMLAGKYIKIYGKQHPEIFQ
jgi:hypothetical protein